MPSPTDPKRSQLDDFLATPMGPGLTGEQAPGQSVHPQAPELRDQDVASSPPSGAAGGIASAEPTKTALGEPLGSQIAAARIGLGDGELRSSSPGEAGASGSVAGADASGLGASLGAGDPAPLSAAPAADPDQAENEQADARLAHTRAQGGKPEWAAPDQTRAQADAGSINNTDGL